MRRYRIDVTVEVDVDDMDTALDAERIVESMMFNATDGVDTMRVEEISPAEPMDGDD